MWGGRLKMEDSSLKPGKELPDARCQKAHSAGRVPSPGAGGELEVWRFKFEARARFVGAGAS